MHNDYWIQENKFMDYEKQKLLENLIIDILNADKNYKDSKERKEIYNIKDKKFRTFISPLGRFRIKLTIYEHKTTRKCFMFKNHWFLKTFKPFQRISNSLANEINNQFIDKVSSRKIAYKYKLTHGTILKIKNSFVKQLKIENNFQDYSKNVTNKDTLIVSMDDTFTKCRRKNKVINLQIRTLNFYLLDHQNKPIFKNHYFILREQNSQKFNNKWLASEIRNIADKYYKKGIKINICGDGAFWIRKIASHLKANFSLCQWHLLRIIRQGFSFNKFFLISCNQIKNKLNWDIEKNIKNLISNGKWEKLKELIFVNHKIIKQYFSNEHYYKMINVLNFLEFNSKTLFKSNNKYVFNTAESYISHLIKDKINKNYSLYNIDSLMYLMINSQYIYQNNISMIFQADKN